MRVSSWVTALWILSACSTDPSPSPSNLDEAGSGGTPSSESGSGAPPAGGAGSSAAGSAGSTTTAGSSSERDAGMDAALPACDPGLLTYEDDVQPLVQSRCVTCHDAGGPSGFDARMLSGLLEGGRNGPAVVPGNCEGSLIWQKTSTMPPFGERMPATGDWLSDAERQLVCDWIDQGAVERAPPCMDVGIEDASTRNDASHDAAANDDMTPPDFDGADMIQEQAEGCVVTWLAAVDDKSAQSRIVYEVFAVEADQPIDYDSPVLVTKPGETSVLIELDAGVDYDIAVLARDEAGNRDDNDRTRSCELSAAP